MRDLEAAVGADGGALAGRPRMRLLCDRIAVACSRRSGKGKAPPPLVGAFPPALGAPSHPHSRGVGCERTQFWGIEHGVGFDAGRGRRGLGVWVLGGRGSARRGRVWVVVFAVMRKSAP